MRFAALALLVSVACEAQPRILDRACDVSSRRSDRGGVACSSQYATGTANAIASYASAPCECAQVSRVCTIPDNGILINERGTESLSGDISPQYAYCAKGNRTTLHAGDLVGCAANIPRIQPTNADGTGALVVLTEAERWNYTAYGSQLDQWQTVAVGPPVPTIVANAAQAADGTATADLVQFKATTATEISSVFQNQHHLGGCPFVDGGRLTASLYASGAVDAGFPSDGGTGTFDICTYTGAAWECSPCTVSAYNPTGSPDGGATGITRCVHANYAQDTNAIPVGYLHVGHASLVNGGTARPLQGFFLSKAQCEEGVSETSPIDTGTRHTLASADAVSVQEPVCRDANVRTAWLGDSLSGMETVGDTYTQLTSRPPSVYATATGRTVDNWAHNGDTVADAILQWSNYGDRTRAQRIVFWAGINDVMGGFANGTTLAGTTTAWVALRAAEGRFVTVVGLAPCKAYSGWTAGKQTQLLAYNTAISTYCGANPTQCIYVDVYVTLTDGSDNLNPAYEAPDHLHFNQAGATAAGNRIASVSP